MTRPWLSAVVYAVVFAAVVSGLTFWLLNHPVERPRVDPSSPEAIAAKAAGQDCPFSRAKTDQEHREIQQDIRARSRVRGELTIGIVVVLWVIHLAIVWRIHQSKQVCLWFTCFTPLAVILALILSLALFWMLSMGGFSHAK